jgi:hypothetical protein
MNAAGNGSRPGRGTQPFFPNEEGRFGATSAESRRSDKHLSTLAASLALKGFALYPLALGGFLIASHDRSEYARDCTGIADFLRALERESSEPGRQHDPELGASKRLLTAPPSQRKPQRRVEGA